VPEGRENLLDPDAIARRINPSDLRKAAINAARETIVHTRGYLREKQSFAIETTLSSGSVLETMSQAVAAGFAVNLIYVSRQPRLEHRACSRTIHSWWS
jgi:predicted ABC-type ATPase